MSLYSLLPLIIVIFGTIIDGNDCQSMSTSLNLVHPVTNGNSGDLMTLQKTKTGVPKLDELSAEILLKSFEENITVSYSLDNANPLVLEALAKAAPFELRKNFPYYLSGYDESGRPIWVFELGKYNIRKFVEQGAEKLKKVERYAEQAAYFAVKSLEDRSTPEEPVTDAIFIIDFDQFKIFQLAHVPTVSFILKLARQYRKIIERYIFIALGLNTNSVAHTLVNMVRPIFGPVFEKVEIYGTNPARYYAHVLKYCPRDQIAPWYGGKKNFKPIKVYG